MHENYSTTVQQPKENRSFVESFAIRSVATLNHVVSGK